MQFKVPQFLDIEDKIFGSLTFSQFVYLVGGAGMCYVLYKILGLLLAFLPILLIAGFSTALAFYRPNGKPFINMLQAGLKYLLQDKMYVWKRRKNIEKNTEKINQPNLQKDLSSHHKLTNSKLKDLAWSLDVLDFDKEKNKMALKAKATQDFVPIKEIRDGVVILKSNDFRAIILANSINLSLKSEMEQQAIILQFKNFLNTLDFPVQISVQSRRLDIRPYLLLLEKRLKEQTEPLLKLQTSEYIDFIKNLTESVSIMTKNFFIVIPYTHSVFNPQKGLFKNPFANKNTAQEKQEEQLDFEEKKNQLEERVNVIQQGLSRCGVKSIQLNTEQIIEVYYKVFNPEELEEKIILEE